MDKETLAANYLATVETLDRLENELEGHVLEQLEFVAETDPKTYGSNESQRDAFLALAYPKIELIKKLIKQTQRRRDYYRDMITLCTS